MANVLTSNPIVVTNAFAAGTSYKGLTASSLGTLTTLRVHHIRWLQPIAVGDILEIIDPQNGVELLTMRCITAGQDIVVDWSANPRLWRDFQVNRLDNGRIYIYLK